MKINLQYRCMPIKGINIRNIIDRFSVKRVLEAGVAVFCRGVAGVAAA
jgi:hypothetical protein